MSVEVVRAKHPDWQVWQSRGGSWWATRRSSRSLPNGASRTVGDARSLEELDALIEADEAFLAEHSHLAPA
ncbi:MAG: hypothetical protein L0Y54_05020 [Sporichthyaceae bacterium]|nr:hypothetical protein [Sporichthyaceae bacterium]